MGMRDKSPGLPESSFAYKHSPTCGFKTLQHLASLIFVTLDLAASILHIILLLYSMPTHPLFTLHLTNTYHGDCILQRQLHQNVYPIPHTLLAR